MSCAPPPLHKRCQVRLERRIAVSAPGREVKAGVKMCGPGAARGSSALRAIQKATSARKTIKIIVSAPEGAYCQRATARGKGNKRASPSVRVKATKKQQQRQRQQRKALSRAASGQGKTIALAHPAVTPCGVAVATLVRHEVACKVVQLIKE